MPEPEINKINATIVTTLLYTSIDSTSSLKSFDQEIDSLPAAMKKQVKSFRRPQDALACLFGKLLLSEGLLKYNINASLYDILYTKNNKPFLKSHEVAFNISHSENLVVCIISSDVDSIGADIEKIKNININDFRKVWTTHEWEVIKSGTIRVFYEHWTRKESVIKADGRGMELNLQGIDVRSSIVNVNSTVYHLKEVDINTDYVLYLAADKKIETIDICNIIF